MPERSDRIKKANEEVEPGELPYISKSRVKSWVKNPEHFRLKYVEGIREPETEAMIRGTRIHEAIEGFYERTQTFCERYRRAPNFGAMPRFLPDNLLWADFVEPYISNFLLFENRRVNEVDSFVNYPPVGIEEECWIEGGDGEPEWMGLADAILHTESVPQVEGDGVVIVDFKTGSVPDPKYRDEGINLELTYYEMLFEEQYDVDGAIGYYPREDEVVVNPSGERMREKVQQAVDEMVTAVAEYDGEERFETKEGPLCKWGEGDDEESAYYGICPCTWGVPANRKDEFVKMVNDGLSKRDIAERLGTTADAVGYWKYKFNL